MSPSYLKASISESHVLSLWCWVLLHVVGLCWLLVKHLSSCRLESWFISILSSLLLSQFCLVLWSMKISVLHLDLSVPYIFLLHAFFYALSAILSCRVSLTIQNWRLPYNLLQTSHSQSNVHSQPCVFLIYFLLTLTFTKSLNLINSYNPFHPIAQ